MRIVAFCLSVALAGCAAGPGLSYVRTAVSAPATVRVVLLSYSNDTLQLSIANDSGGPLKFLPSSMRMSDGSRSKQCFGSPVTLARNENLEVVVRCDWIGFPSDGPLTVSFDDGVQTAAGPVRLTPLVVRVVHAP